MPRGKKRKDPDPAWNETSHTLTSKGMCPKDTTPSTIHSKGDAPTEQDSDKNVSKKPRHIVMSPVLAIMTSAYNKLSSSSSSSSSSAASAMSWSEIDEPVTKLFEMRYYITFLFDSDTLDNEFETLNCIAKQVVGCGLSYIIRNAVYENGTTSMDAKVAIAVFAQWCIEAGICLV